MQPKRSTIKQIYQQLPTEHFDFQVLPSVNLVHHQWSNDMIKEDIQKSKTLIQNVVKEAKGEIDLLKRIMPLVSDCLFLKGGIFTIYNQLKLYCKNLKKDDLYQIMKNMYFSGFVILLLKMTQEKDIFGLLLSFTRVPLPIYFKVANKPIKMTQLLKGIMSIDRLSLILNCGSGKARKCGKTTFLFELFSLPKDYIYKQNQLYEDSVYVQKIFPGSENNLLLDFNGSFENMPTQVSFLHKNCGLLIMHILESELFEDGEYKGQQYFSKHQNFFSPPEKIILLVRNCENLRPENISESLGNLKEKCYIFCLSQEVESEVYQQIADLIQKNNLFKLKKTYNYFDILNDPTKTQDVERFYKESKNITSTLPSPEQVETKENLTEKLFPHLFLSNRISILKSTLLEKQLNFKIIAEQKKQQEFKKINQIEKEILDCEQKLKVGSQINDFVKKGFEILTNGIRVPEQVQVFNTMLYLWKKQMVKPLLFQYIKISKAINDLAPSEFKKKQLFLKDAEQIEVKLDMYDISSTTILNDVITKLTFSDQKNENQQQKINRKLHETTIETSYNQSYRSMYPINLVDGKNLLFGNKYLKEFCKNLSLDKRFTNKKTYIISVIGAQSSGKSTLLNYLFRCQFQTSAGRCTKGMYFNICELDDKVIWLIDTEGLLSLNARDPLFDNKIATFVLSISDIVIINNKGQLTSQMRDMLEICTFAMKYLRKEDKVGTFKPQKLIFALRDQAMPKEGQKFQEQMVSKIMTQFEKSKEKLDLNYKQYLDIQPEDIISFPSIFNEADVKIKTLGTFESYSETFGRCIVGLRSRIINILDNENKKQKQPKTKTIFDCYTQGEFCWETILKCGSDLMNYKTILELEAKQNILKTFDKLLPNFNKRLSDEYEKLFESLTKNLTSEALIKKQNDIKKSLYQKKEQLDRDFQNQLRSECGSVSSKNEWFEVCNNKILTLCQAYQNQYIDLLSKTKTSRSQNQSQNEFKKRIQQQVDGLLLKTASQNQIFSSLNKLKQQILSNYEKEFQEFTINSSTYQIELAGALPQGFKDEKINNNGASWVSDYKSLIQKKNYQDMYNIKYEHFYNLLSAKDKKDMVDSFKSLLEKIRQMSEKNTGIANLKKIKDVSLLSQSLDKSLSSLRSEVQDSLNSKRQKSDITLNLLSYEKVKMREILRGCLICNIAEIFARNQKKALEKKKQTFLQLIQNQYKKIKDAFANKNDIKKISLSWISQIKQLYEEELKNGCEDKLRVELNRLNMELDPERIVDKAFTQSYLSSQTDKSKWVQCFKMMSDINKYLFEILCKQSIVQTRKALSSNILAIQRQKIVQKIDTQCIKYLSGIESAQENSNMITNFKSKFGLLHTSNFSNKNILILLRSCLQEPQFYLNWIQQIKSSITSNELNISMEKYIRVNIRDNIIGCQNVCPFCGVKCKKTKGHQGGHQVKSACHVLSCFYGQKWNKTKTPCYFICGSKRHLAENIIYRVEGENWQPTIEYTRLIYPAWYEHFKQMVDRSMFQSTLDELKYQQIWANTRHMLIKHKYTQMIDDNEYDKFLNNPLTDEDLQKTMFENLEGQNCSLLNYVGK